MQPTPPPRLWVSLVQFDIALGRPEENLQRALDLLDQIGPERPHVALLPEVFTTAFTFHDADRIGAFSAEALARLGERARQGQMALAGSIIEPLPEAEGRFANRAFFLDERGERLSAYAKRHLIRLGHEHLFYTPGEAGPPAPLLWQGMPVALAICYDLRFAEWIGRLLFGGATLLLVPAQWPAERALHWRTLLRARAIENQCFVAGCNRIGTSESLEFSGGSEIFGPWGESLARAENGGEGIACAPLEMGRIDEVRTLLPAFAERAREEQAR